MEGYAGLFMRDRRDCSELRNLKCYSMLGCCGPAEEGGGWGVVCLLTVDD